MAPDPRRLAFDVLRAVDDRDAYANLELARLAKERKVSGRDAGFATELVSGTLRMHGAYDAVLDALVSRPLDPPVRDALRLGAHQLLSMRVPAHAAVGTTVSLVRSAIGHRPAGLVNAVLRKVGSRDFDGWMAHLDASLAVRTSHPQWVVDLLAEALGGDPTELLLADNLAPKVTLVALPGLAGTEELGGRPLSASPYAVELAGGDPGALAAVREGRAGVQDAGSQLVAITLERAALGGRDERWLDVCAGPGGKAALLAALAAKRGARVLANERAPHRAELVRSSLRALTVPPARGVAGIVVGDGTRPAWPPASFDRVLVDAPCSGLGALRRRPEARWRRKPADIEALVPLQVALLHAALDSTRGGGVVVYATCSPVVAETAGVVSTVLAGRNDVRLAAAVDLLPWLEDAASTALPGAVQLWPHRHGTDAMFIALLRRG